ILSDTFGPSRVARKTWRPRKYRTALPLPCPAISRELSSRTGPGSRSAPLALGSPSQARSRSPPWVRPTRTEFGNHQLRKGSSAVHRIGRKLLAQEPQGASRSTLTTLGTLITSTGCLGINDVVESFLVAKAFACFRSCTGLSQNRYHPSSSLIRTRT